MMTLLAFASPITITVGIGARVHTSTPNVQDANDITQSEHLGAALHATIEHTIRPDLAVGVRVGLATPREFETFWYGTMNGDGAKYRDLPLEAGIVLRKTVGSMWLAPWVGGYVQRREAAEYACHKLTCSDSTPLPADWSSAIAVGFGIGVELLRTGENRIGLVLDAGRSSIYSAMGFGLVLRR